MPLNPAQTAVAKLKGDALYEHLHMSWSHITGAAQGGPTTMENLAAGVQGANNQLSSVENALKEALRAIIEWGAARDYKARYLEDVGYWSINLRIEIRVAVSTSRPARNTLRLSGKRTPDDILEDIRGTLNYVRDPYHLEYFRPLPGYRKSWDVK